MTAARLRIIIGFITIGIAAFLLILWLVNYSQLNLPEKIPGLELRLYGIFIMVAFVVIFIFFQKSLMKSEPGISVLQMIGWSTVIAIASSLFYQIIRQLVIQRGQYHYDAKTVLLSTLVSAILLLFIAATVAIELKKIKGIWRQVPLVLLIIIMFWIKQYPPQLEW